MNIELRRALFALRDLVRRGWIVVLVMVLSTASLSAQVDGAPSVLTIDLGAVKPGNPVTTSIEPGRYRITVINRMRSSAYKLSVRLRTTPIPDLGTFPAAAPMDSAEKARAAALAKACPKLTAVDDGLKSAATETDVKKQVDASDNAFASEEAKADCAVLAQQVRAKIHETTQVVNQVFRVRNGQSLEVSVARLDAAGAEQATWRVTFDAGGRGNWRTTYGFSTIFTQLGGGSGPFAKPGSFFAREVGEDRYVITEEKDRRGLDVAPVIALSFMPTAAEASAWSRGWQVGLGLDLSEPMVTVGYGLAYNQNFVANVGAVVRRESVLLGKYSGGDTVTEALTAEQLHENTFRIRPQLALTLRFSGNPFSKPKEAEPADESEKQVASGRGDNAPTVVVSRGPAATSRVAARRLSSSSVMFGECAGAACRSYRSVRTP
jgi:hypothetical protein